MTNPDVNNQTALASFTQYLANFKDKRLVTVFFFGIASGYPWVMIGSAMSAWLKDEGISRSSIGFFGIVFAVFSINFLWSPLLDRIKLPLLYQRFGLRRSWLLVTQITITGACLVLSQFNAAEHMIYAGLLAFIIAIAASTQDIAIDAYRIDIIDQKDQQKIAAGAAMATSGWWTGYAGLGFLAFYLSDIDNFDWPQVYMFLGLIMLLLMIATLKAIEPQINRTKMQSQIEQDFADMLHMRKNSLIPQQLLRPIIWIIATIAGPIRDFFQRNGVKLALSLLLFIVLFKLGEAFLGRMSIVFYKEIGFTNTQIGFYSKLISWWVTILFSIVGSLFTMRFGIVKGLFIGGIAMSASNLMFAAIALVGPSEPLFLAAVLIDGFTMAWSSVAVVAFISMLCNRAFSASQYALMASLSSLGRTLIGSSSGALVDYLNGNWALFFVLTTIAVLPSLALLYWIKDDLKKIEQGYQQN